MITAIANGAITDRYYSSGKTIQQVGWKVLDFQTDRKKSKKAKAGEELAEEEQALPVGLARGQSQDVIDAEGQRKKTRAPKRFTEATLLTAMETAGKTLDEKELSDAMKETGLGTPATRASIIEVLLKREYIVRNVKNLEATDKGIRLIEVVHPEVKSPAMTGQWEAYLKRIQRGDAQLAPFMHGIEGLCPGEFVGEGGADCGGPRRENGDRLRSASPEPAPSETAAPQVTAAEGEPLDALLHRAFGFAAFRANQEEVCRTVIEGRDALLVMPTSRRRQIALLPTARPRARRHHAGRQPPDRADGRSICQVAGTQVAVGKTTPGRIAASMAQVCIDYLSRLQFLFVAPERLLCRGFGNARETETRAD